MSERRVRIWKLFQYYRGDILSSCASVAHRAQHGSQPLDTRSRESALGELSAVFASAETCAHQN